MSTRVAVLAGGPDAEREVSLESAAAVAGWLGESESIAAHVEEIDRIDVARLAEARADVLFPVLHGPLGEGGAMQVALEADGRPYVGSGPVASRRAIDKLYTKSVAAGLGIDVTPSGAFDASSTICPFDLPVVVKPVFEGSTIGLFVCRTPDAWRAAHGETAASGRVAMVEPYIAGRELTVSVLETDGGLVALPIVEIQPASGLYDYEAKYRRDDTVYTVDPVLPAGIAGRLQREAIGLCEALDVRDLCRVDTLLDEEGRAWLLEANTMPGCTSHSLFPMAARAAGLSLAEVCRAMVERAQRRA